MKTAIAATVVLALIGATVAEAKAIRTRASALKIRAAQIVQPEPIGAMQGAVLVNVARFYIGRNPTEMSHVWCGRFMRLVVERATGRDPGPEFDAASKFARLGRPGRAGAGAIVVWSRGNGRGHVGVVVQITGHGRAVVISGNDGPAGGRQVIERERSIAGALFRYL